MPIRLRLSLVLASLAIVLVLAGALVLEASLQAGMRATLEDSLRRAAAGVTAELLAHRLEPAGPSGPTVPVSDQSTVQVLLQGGQVAYTTTEAGRAPLLSGHELAAAARGEVFLQRSRRSWHDPHLLLGEPAKGTPGAVLVVGRSLDELANATNRLHLVLLVGGPLVVAAVGGGAWLLAGLALRPVERLRAEAAAISREHPDRRLAEPGTHDEVARLAGTLNALLDRLHAALVHQRQFVADASHELRAPLAAIGAELELAQRPGRSAADLSRSLGVLRSRVAQLRRMSEDLLLLARGDEAALDLKMTTQPLEPVVAASLQSLRPVADARGVDLVLDVEPAVLADLDGIRFQQVVDNLVDNALAHSAPGSAIEVRVRHEQDSVVVEVRDRGPGFPEEFLPRAFERFATAGPARPEHRRGVGLGLAVVRALVDGHGGTVVARNRPGGGASVVVSLPARHRSTQPEEEAP